MHSSLARTILSLLSTTALFPLWLLMLADFFPRLVFATPEQPELTFEHLYRFGREAYTAASGGGDDGQWENCVSFMRRALDDFHYYRSGVVRCSRECRRQPPGFNGGETEMKEVEEDEEEEFFFKFWSLHAQRAKCMLKCQEGEFTAQRPPLHHSASIGGMWEFERWRRPYHYLQFCYWKLGDVRAATQAAYTYLMANPQDEDTLANLRFYERERRRRQRRGREETTDSALSSGSSLSENALSNNDKEEEEKKKDAMIEEVNDAKEGEGDSNPWLVDMLQADYEKAYMAGVHAYDSADWPRCISSLEQAVIGYLSALDECRILCDYERHVLVDDGKSAMGAAEFSTHLTSLHQSVLRCKAVECPATLNRVNGLQVGGGGGLLSAIYDYLHICQFRMQRGREACRSVGNGLLLRPGNLLLRRNRMIYGKMYAHRGEEGEVDGKEQEAGGADTNDNIFFISNQLFAPSTEILALHRKLSREQKLLHYVDDARFTKYYYTTHANYVTTHHATVTLNFPSYSHAPFNYTLLEAGESSLLSSEECLHLVSATIPLTPRIDLPLYRYWRLLLAELGQRIAALYSADQVPTPMGLYCSSPNSSSGGSKNLSNGDEKEEEKEMEWRRVAAAASECEHGSYLVGLHSEKARLLQIAEKNSDGSGKNEKSSTPPPSDFVDADSDEDDENISATNQQHPSEGVVVVVSSCSAQVMAMDEYRERVFGAKSLSSGSTIAVESTDKSKKSLGVSADDDRDKEETVDEKKEEESIFKHKSSSSSNHHHHYNYCVALFCL